MIPSIGLVRGWTVFEWILGGRFLLQRSGTDHPDAPDAFSVNAPDGDGLRQHYFDSRGVVRLYAMTVQDGRWTLLRESADFSPLDFRQRYVGAFGDGGKTIRGRWETAQPGEDWQLDFELVHTRVIRGEDLARAARTRRQD